MKNGTQLLSLLVAIGIAGLTAQAQAQVGANLPFSTYEAENGSLGGGASVSSLLSPPATEFSSPELEASGHAYVKLTGTGQSVSWTNNTGKNITALNLRYCIPDSSTGGGQNSMIDLYVDGTFRQAINLTSTQTWVYESTSNYNGMNQAPSSGSPRVFWDEARTLVTGTPIAPGSTITIQQDAADNLAFYYIDCIDLEAPTPLSQSANSLSITSYGAVANNPSVDNTNAIQNCINAAQSSGSSVWIPQGIFYISNSGAIITSNNITIQGAGPWFSTICDNAPPNSRGGGCLMEPTSTNLENFCVDSVSVGSGTTTAGGLSAFLPAGNNYSINNVWSRHLILTWLDGSNITIQNCRVNNSYGDGINLNEAGSQPANNIVVQNNFFRGNGDDCIAVNDSYPNTPTMSNITIQNNTCEAMWGGKGVALDGGTNLIVQNNYIADSARYTGLGVGYFQIAYSIQGALVQNNTVVRCGGNGFGQQQAALDIGTSPPNEYAGWGMTPSNVVNAVVVNNTVSNSVFGAVSVDTSSGLVFQNNVLSSPSLFYGLVFNSTAVGNGVFNDNVVGGLSQGESALFEGAVPTYDLQTSSSPVTGVVAASSYNNMSNVQSESCSEGGTDVGSILPNSYTEYNNVNLNGVTTFAARVASATSGGNITIHLDSPTGTVIGTATVPGTGGWQTWITVTCGLSGASGYHNVYLVYNATYSNYLLNIEWFAFMQASSVTEAASYNSMSNVQSESSSEGGTDLGYIGNGSYSEYNNVNLNGVSAFQARVASPYGGATINVCLDSPNGTVIGTCTVPNTGGWQAYTTVNCLISGATGYHNVYLVYTAGFNIEWFNFTGIMNPTQTACFNTQNNTVTENCSEGGWDVSDIYNGSWSEYNSVYLNGVTSFKARVASAGGGGNINICLDSPTGTVIGTVAVPITGGWQTWTTVNCPVSGASGYHNVYLVYNGNGGLLFNVEWFAFQSAPINIQTACFNSQNNTVTESNCTEGGSYLDNIYNGSWSEYNNINLNGDVFFSARVASAGSGGSINICLDSPTGTVIGTVPVPVTGGWQNWTTVTCGLTGASGYHNVYLVYNGSGGLLFNVEWFAFQPSDSQIAAVGYSGAESGTYPATQSCSEGGQDLTNLYNGYYVYYNNINLTGVTSFAVRTASADTSPWGPGVAGTITLNLDSPTGPVIGTCSVNLTGGWQTWTTESCPISGASGTHNVYVNFTGNGGQLFNIEWFDFLQ